MDSVVEVFAGKVKTKSRSGHTLAGAALSHKTLTMTRLAPTLIRSFFTILAVIAFSAFIFGQPNLDSDHHGSGDAHRDEYLQPDPREELRAAEGNGRQLQGARGIEKGTAK
jgi:hypothetical protein